MTWRRRVLLLGLSAVLAVSTVVFLVAGWSQNGLGVGTTYVDGTYAAHRNVHVRAAVVEVVTDEVMRQLQSTAHRRRVLQEYDETHGTDARTTVRAAAWRYVGTEDYAKAWIEESWQTQQSMLRAMRRGHSQADGSLSVKSGWFIIGVRDELIAAGFTPAKVVGWAHPRVVMGHSGLLRLLQAHYPQLARVRDLAALAMVAAAVGLVLVERRRGVLVTGLTLTGVTALVGLGILIAGTAPPGAVDPELSGPFVRGLLAHLWTGVLVMFIGGVALTVLIQTSPQRFAVDSD